MPSRHRVDRKWAGRKVAGRKWAAAAAGIVALGIVGAFTLPSMLGSSSSAATLPLPAPGAVPAAYHVVYRVTTGSVVTTEELWVQRPFEAEHVIVAGLSPDKQSRSTVVDRLGRQLVRSGGEPAVFEPPPGPSSFDVRLDATGPGALHAGALVRRGQRVVAGRRCQVYRSAQSLVAGTLAGRPTAADHVDTCIDGQGLVLEEQRVAGGKLVQHRQATAVVVGTDPLHPFATPGNHIPLRQGGGAVVTISDDSRPPGSPFWAVPRPPAGFRHLGRFAVVPPQPPVEAPQSRSTLVTAVDDVFVRGADVLVIEQGQTAGAAPIQPPTGGSSVDAGRLGHGQLVLSALSASVTVLTNKSSFVRVSGTLPPAEVLAVARTLEQQPPGTIQTVPDLTSDGP